jgi:hypothetical protein
MLETGKGRWYVRAMKIRNRKTPTSEKLRQAMESIGGEPLEGSGFEDETPEPEFSGTFSAPVPICFLCPSFGGHRETLPQATRRIKQID